MIKAVVFDMDGTLVDTEKYLVEYWEKAGKLCGYPMTREDGLFLRSLASQYAVPAMKQRLGEDFDYYKVRRCRIELMDKAGLPTECKPGAKEVLARLKERNIRTAVATASAEEKARRVLTETGLYDSFSCVICAPDMEHGKPMPDVYLHACRVLGEKPKDCMAVEDSPNGVLSAFRAGLRTIMVPDLTAPDETIRDCLYGVAEELTGILKFLD